MQRVLQRAGQVLCFFRGEIAGDYSGVIGNLCLNYWSRDDFSVENDREAIIDVVPGDSLKDLSALGIKTESNLIATLFESGVCPGHLIPSQLGAAFYEVFFPFSVSLDAIEDDVSRRRKVAAVLDLWHQLVALGMNQPEFQFGHA